MTLTLSGRLQTRLFLGATVGVVWTAIITPFLPRPPAFYMSMTSMPMTRMMLPILFPSSIGEAYQMTFETLGLMVVLGLGWEVLYHFLQQFRWDKDWPPIFTLAVGVPEAIVLWLVLHVIGLEYGSIGLSSPNFVMFIWDFTTTWVLLWLAETGPLKVLSLRWRFEGGTFV